MKPRRAPGAAARANPPGQVRLIGGRFRRSKLPVADAAGLRPTPDRVRETLFNWLGQDLSGWVVLDAFAGSGALGFEAASRGAATVVMLERDAALVASLQASRQRLGAAEVEIVRADAIAWMRSSAQGHFDLGPDPGFDLVLLDPPFDSALHEAAAAAAAPLVRATGFLYVEAPHPGTFEVPGFDLYRSLRAGVVQAQLWRRACG